MGFVWLGIHEPTEQEMQDVATHFPVHELAIEDAASLHQRAKIENYENHYFVVLRTARYDDDREQVDFGEIHIFAGPGYAITVRHGEASELRPARQRLELVRSSSMPAPWPSCGPCSTRSSTTTNRWSRA